MTAASPPAAPLPTFTLGPAMAWLAERAALDEDAMALVSSDAALAADAASAARRLIAVGRPADGLRIAACALPPREGVWWAWVSARHAGQVAAQEGKAADPAVANALAATETWINQPSDDTRRAAWAAADAAGLDTAGGAAAGSVYFTGGSISPSDAPPVAPPPGLHSTMIATAVTMAAATKATALEFVANAYLDQAIEIIKQLGGWDRTVGLARQYHEAQREQHEAQLKAGKPQSAGAARGG